MAMKEMLNCCFPTYRRKVEGDTKFDCFPTRERLQRGGGLCVGFPRWRTAVCRSKRRTDTRGLEKGHDEGRRWAMVAVNR